MYSGVSGVHVSVYIYIYSIFSSEIWLKSSQVQESTIAECIASSLYLISLFHHRLDQLSCPKQVDPTICFHFISAELSQKWQLTNPFQCWKFMTPSDNFKMFFSIFVPPKSSSFKRQPFWPPRCSSLPPHYRISVGHTPSFSRSTRGRTFGGTSPRNRPIFPVKLGLFGWFQPKK